MVKEPEEFSSDAPLIDPSHDMLGYASFAQTIAKSILNMLPVDGIVIALNGPWGSGKSTTINFIKHYLRDAPIEKQPIIVNFNPWWFSNREDLTRLLIGQLNVSLGKKDYKKIKSLIANFGDLVSNIPIKGSEIGKYFATKLREQPDLQGLKEKIGKNLLEKNKKILVIIDDVDRLSATEICTLFAAIKSVSNFPNVIYLLSFDNQIVIKSLDQIFEHSGKDYLDKIIQVPFILPFPDKISINTIFLNRLDSIMSGEGSEYFDKIYWGNIFHAGINVLIKTPRDINRLINTLISTYPALKGEINPIDFIAIESIRIFYPGLYDEIRSNKEQLTGPFSWANTQSSEKAKLSTFYERLLNIPPSSARESIKSLLSVLFPKTLSVFSNSIIDPSYLSIWRRQLRICSPDIFDNYFRFSVSPDTISAFEMKSIIDSTSSEKEFVEKLLSLSKKHFRDGSTYLRVALERIEDFIDMIQNANITTIVNVFINIGDNLMLPEDSGKGVFDFRSNKYQMSRIILYLIKRVDQSERYEIIRSAISKGHSLRLSAFIVARLGHQHGKFGETNPLPESDRFINAEQQSLLEQLVLEKIRSAAKKRTFIDTPELLSLINFWKAISTVEEVKKWVEKVTKTDIGLINFLTRIGDTAFSYTFGELSDRTHYRLNPNWLKEFLDPDSVVKRINKIVASNSFSEEQLKPLNQYLKEYQIIKAGKNPDDSFDR